MRYRETFWGSKNIYYKNKFHNITYMLNENWSSTALLGREDDIEGMRGNCCGLAALGLCRGQRGWLGWALAAFNCRQWYLLPFCAHIIFIWYFCYYCVALFGVDFYFVRKRTVLLGSVVRLLSKQVFTSFIRCAVAIMKRINYKFIRKYSLTIEFL